VLQIDLSLDVIQVASRFFARSPNPFMTQVHRQAVWL
jgi:hypothetical protein